MFPSKAEMEISAVRPDELESLLALICEVFGLPYEPAREIFYGDPYLNLENKRVLRVGGRIVSCLSIADREVWLGSKKVRVGGIAGVATRPEERGKGYASLLISDTLDFLKAQGYALSALIPYSSHFYRRLGYEICGNACRYITSPSFLPSSREIQNVRPARSNDASALERCYDTWSWRNSFFGIRDEQRWQYLLKNVQQCHIYIQEGNGIAGYLLTDIRQNPPAFEGEVSMPTLRVLEFAAQTKKARQGLTAYLAAQTAFGMVEFSLPAPLLSELQLDSLMGTGIGEEILANIEIVPMLMARILNFCPLIEAHLPTRETNDIYSRWEGRLRLEICDSAQTSPPESWTLLREPKGNTVRPSLPSEHDLPCLFGDLRVWAQVVTGFKSADDAIAQGSLFASNETASNRGSVLFKRSHPFLPTPDHF